jgi:hypothetical protein
MGMMWWAAGGMAFAFFWWCFVYDGNQLFSRVVFVVVVYFVCVWLSLYFLLEYTVLRRGHETQHCGP